MKKYLLLLTFPLLLWSASVQATDSIPEKPDNNVYDQNHYLSYKVINKVADYNTKQNTPIAIYVEQSLYGDEIDLVAKSIAKKWWGDNVNPQTPVLVVVSIDDGLAKIEVPPRATQKLTEGEADVIVLKNKKRLLNQEYDSAVLSIIDNLASELNGSETSANETTEEPNTSQNDPSKLKVGDIVNNLSWTDTAIIIEFVVVFLMILGSSIMPILFFVGIFFLIRYAAKQQKELNNNPNNPSNNTTVTPNEQTELVEAVATKQSIFSSLKSLFNQEKNYSNVPFENNFESDSSSNPNKIPTYQEWKDKNK